MDNLNLNNMDRNYDPFEIKAPTKEESDQKKKWPKGRYGSKETPYPDAPGDINWYKLHDDWKLYLENIDGVSIKRHWTDSVKDHGWAYEKAFHFLNQAYEKRWLTSDLETETFVLLIDLEECYEQAFREDRAEMASVQHDAIWTD